MSRLNSYLKNLAIIIGSISFRNNRLTPEGAVVIGKGLSLNESLQVLKVSDMS